MSIDLILEWFFRQKSNYLYEKPCEPHWQLAGRAENDTYSSASFYETGIDQFDFITHHSEIRTDGQTTSNN